MRDGKNIRALPFGCKLRPPVARSSPSSGDRLGHVFAKISHSIFSLYINDLLAAQRFPICSNDLRAKRVIRRSLRQEISKQYQWAP